MDGGQLGDMSRMGFMGGSGSGSAGEGDSLGRGREDENDSRSGSDNVDGASGDELDPDNSNPRKKKKRYHRHTPQQIQELEAYVVSPFTSANNSIQKEFFFVCLNFLDLMRTRMQCVQGVPPPRREAKDGAQQAAQPGEPPGQVLVPEPAHADEGLEQARSQSIHGHGRCVSIELLLRI